MISESESCQRQIGDCTAVPNGDELRRIVRSVRTNASDDASPTEYVLAGWKAAMLAASTAPQPAPAPLSDEREAFEKAYAKQIGMAPARRKHHPDLYMSDEANTAWHWFQVGAALMAQENSK